jgi:hypothetical protein
MRAESELSKGATGPRRGWKRHTILPARRMAIAMGFGGHGVHVLLLSLWLPPSQKNARHAWVVGLPAATQAGCSFAGKEKSSYWVNETAVGNGIGRSKAGARFT